MHIKLVTTSIYTLLVVLLTKITKLTKEINAFNRRIYALGGLRSYRDIPSFLHHHCWRSSDMIILLLSHPCSTFKQEWGKIALWHEKDRNFSNSITSTSVTFERTKKIVLVFRSHYSFMIQLSMIGIRWRRSHLSSPLSAIVSEKTKFVWEDEQQKLFRAIKVLISRERLLLFPNFTKEFHMYTNASDYQLGAIVMQSNKLLTFYSRKVNWCCSCLMSLAIFHHKSTAQQWWCQPE